MTFKPMLAADLSDVDLSTLRYPLLVSPKLDGIRCLVIDGVAYSRNMKPIRNKTVQEWAAYWRGKGTFDGELIAGSPTDPNCMNNTQSVIMSATGGGDWQFHVFDAYVDGTFDQRVLWAADIKDDSEHGWRVELVPHFLVHNERDLEFYEARVLEDGYEGVMLRDPKGPYKNGRSTLREGYLMKLKRFMDGEAVIIGFEEAQENQNTLTRDELGRAKRSSHKENLVGKGMVGTILVTDKTWGTMRLSPGKMTHRERVYYWNNVNDLVGKSAHWRAFGYGVKDKPRFPRFYGIREDL
jgi:DNA ligase-1